MIILTHKAPENLVSHFQETVGKADTVPKIMEKKELYRNHVIYTYKQT